MDILKLMDRLEELMESSRSLPFGKKLIDEDKVFVLINRIRAALPEEIKQAKQISKEREKILFQAQEEADAILVVARQKVEQMVVESEVIRTAEREAGRIVQEAEIRASETRAGADRYAGDVLSRVGNYLDRAQSTISAALGELQSHKSED